VASPTWRGDCSSENPPLAHPHTPHPLALARSGVRGDIQRLAGCVITFGDSSDLILRGSIYKLYPFIRKYVIEQAKSVMASIATSGDSIGRGTNQWD
jgi:hypothetical protein